MYDPIVSQALGEIRGLLAGQPLVAVADTERLVAAQIRIRDLAFYLATIPENERYLPLDSVLTAADSLWRPGGVVAAQELLAPGTVGVGEEIPATTRQGTERVLPYAPRVAPIATPTASAAVCNITIGVVTIVTAGLLLRWAARRNK